jgi:hypothetical protein
MNKVKCRYCNQECYLVKSTKGKWYLSTPSPNNGGLWKVWNPRIKTTIYQLHSCSEGRKVRRTISNTQLRPDSLSLKGGGVKSSTS